MLPNVSKQLLSEAVVHTFTLVSTGLKSEPRVMIQVAPPPLLSVTAAPSPRRLRFISAFLSQQQQQPWAHHTLPHLLVMHYVNTFNELTVSCISFGKLVD